MCRHVQRVRRGRRKLCVLSRGRKALFGHVRFVVGVDQIMRYSGVLRLFGKEFFKHCRGFRTGGIVLVRVCGEQT